MKYSHLFYCVKISLRTTVMELFYIKKKKCMVMQSTETHPGRGGLTQLPWKTVVTTFNIFFGPGRSDSGRSGKAQGQRRRRARRAEPRHCCPAGPCPARAPSPREQPHRWRLCLEPALGFWPHCGRKQSIRLA